MAGGASRWPCPRRDDPELSSPVLMSRGTDIENSLIRASGAWDHSLHLTHPTSPLPTLRTQAGWGEGAFRLCDLEGLSQGGF